MSWTNIKDEVWPRINKVQNILGCELREATGAIALLWRNSQDIDEEVGDRKQIFSWAELRRLDDAALDAWLEAFIEARILTVTKDGLYKIQGNDHEIEAKLKRNVKSAKGAAANKAKWDAKKKVRAMVEAGLEPGSTLPVDSLELSTRSQDSLELSTSYAPEETGVPEDSSNIAQFNSIQGNSIQCNSLQVPNGDESPEKVVVEKIHPELSSKASDWLLAKIPRAVQDGWIETFPVEWVKAQLKFIANWVTSNPKKAPPHDEYASRANAWLTRNWEAAKTPVEKPSVPVRATGVTGLPTALESARTRKQLLENESRETPTSISLEARAGIAWIQGGNGGDPPKDWTEKWIENHMRDFQRAQG